MSQDPVVARLVEKQMRNWELARQQRLENNRAARQQQEVADFVTVSRAIGSTGAEAARRLAERLGWPCFDKELLQHMAGDDRLRTRLYEDMDERDTNWLESALRWVLHGEFRQEDYFHRLTETVLALARQGPAIFLGRGVDLILPPERGLRVRFLAPEEDRVAELARRYQCDEKAARERIEAIEREQADYLRRYFRVAADDPTRFDLLINLGRMSHADAVELIVAALKRRGVAVT